MITNHIKEYKIDIGNHPEFQTNKDEILKSYDAIINVSDDPMYGFELSFPKIYWFPINEFGYWTYQPFYWLVHILDRHVKENHKIYIHCHAGAHRSPMMGYLYIRSLGKSTEEAFALFEETLALGNMGNWIEEIFKNDIEYGRIPMDIVDFMSDVRKNPEKSLMSIMKLRNNFDVPQQTIDKNGIRKPVGKEQLWQWHNGVWSKQEEKVENS